MREKHNDWIFEYDLSIDTREIFLFPDIVDHNVASKFIKSVRILERKKAPIIVHQHSIGGDTMAGMAMYDIIRNSACPFVFLTYGVAASMGSIIPQAASLTGYRITMPSCDWLIHEGHVSIEETRRATKSFVESQEKFTNNMYSIFTEVCSNGTYFKDTKPSHIKAFLKKKLSSKVDWWLSSQEAVDYGFADAIYGSEGFESIEAICTKL